MYDRLLHANPTLRDAAIGRARTLAWAGHSHEAAVAFDSLVASDTTDPEALVGRGQLRAWAERYAAADDDYRRALVTDPRRVDAIVGLGYTALWRGRHRAAEHRAAEALALDPESGEARELARAVRGATRPAFETGGGWNNDSDRNTTWTQRLEVSQPLGDRLRAMAGASALQARDRVRSATGTGAEVGLAFAAGPVRLTAAGGARFLTTTDGADRTSATYRVGVSYRAVRAATVSGGYSRAAFDDVAGLIARRLDVENLEGGVRLTPYRGVELTAGGGLGWLSDGNQRSTTSASVVQPVWRGAFVGGVARQLRYDHAGAGYFSPDRFSIVQGQTGYVLNSAPWSARVAGGLGSQWVGKTSASQLAWSVEARAGRAWGAGNRADLFAAITNSAANSTTGAFRSWTAGIALQLGL